eukprot:CAMPEP_0115220958 /NCGR_PEP_ID=MMETSP0270-20121206/27717_1 /TAXON_ID=71861 /ORGANISM="Scrippsiella trochoidea, Strain CCMP3099" /LENGTH=105 /DNA_ID=CAMNT_0002635033 /DNA_START=747 /DNA_END=1064 /DNA_ORIENTATION=-
MPTDAAGEGGREADASVELESMSQARAPRHASHKFKHLSRPGGGGTVPCFCGAWRAVTPKSPGKPKAGGQQPIKHGTCCSEVSPDKTAAGTGNIARPVEQPNRCH